jgi:methionyl-tRNA synthetase
MAFYVTTPIYYVNAAPHLGHAYSTIAADVLARHHRQRGEDTFFLTGTDEHGEPIVQAAERAGTTPQELADRHAERFRALMPYLSISNDFFIRTSDPRHERKVQEVMQRVHDNGHVYRGTYEGWYCGRCADFKTENEIAEGNTCPIHRIPLEREHEENWFFALSAFQAPLERLYAEHPEWVLPRQRFNEARSFITGGLQDVSLTRNKTKLSWGVEVPWDPEHVFYVWFDALLNYYTALSFASGDGSDITERFWPATHVMAKDILKFHAVIWPALLLAAGIPLPERLFIHGYLLMDDHKMSKSLGNVLDPFEIVDRFGPDPLRYYLMRDVPFGQDGSVSTAAFEARYESELANDYGNLASRTLAMIDRYRDGVVPQAQPDLDLAAHLHGAGDALIGAFDELDVTSGLAGIWEHVRELNRFVEENAPWQLAKDPGQAQRLDQVLYSLAEGVRVVTILLAAYMPGTAERLLEALAAPEQTLEVAHFGARPGGARIEKLPPLFPKAR